MSAVLAIGGVLLVSAGLTYAAAWLVTGRRPRRNPRRPR